MLKTKKSKVSRMRGTSSHGWGHKKKHRGAGHRGGKGLAGTGARGDSQKVSILVKSKSILQKMAAVKGTKMSKLIVGKAYYGKKGFNSIHAKKTDVLSLNYIENNFDVMIDKGMIVKEKTEFVFDSTAFKYDKILGKGSFSKKVTIICNDISESAKQKVEDAGGKVVIIGETSKEE